MLEESRHFMPHGHCYLWLPGVLWTHVISDLLIGVAYLGISLILYTLVRRIRLPFSPVFIAFGLFIGLCGLTHFMSIWTVWHPDYLLDGMIKAATAAASVATAIGLVYVKPQVEKVVHAAQLSEERRIRLESTHAELEGLYAKVKQLDQMKTAFFANVSHELRTPLALILGPAARMLETPDLGPAQRRRLESISHNSKILLKQVDDLLDVAKLEAGKMEIHYVRIDLASWFRRVAVQFELFAEQRHQHYRISAPDMLTGEVDPELLERVVVNLLANAFKFTPPGGHVDIALQADRDQFVLTVSDSGPGIEADQHEAIFERFRQGDAGATRRHGGTGLGLAIVKEFVELHGGAVTLASAAGQGAVFTVCLPLSAPTAMHVASASHPNEATARAANPVVESTLQQLGAHEQGVSIDSTGTIVAAPRPRPSVLVVEDNLEMRTFVADILGDMYDVVAARDGREGLERALALSPDLIVTDLMMPHMSGDQLIGALRERTEFAATPILMLTAKTDDDLRVQLLKSGAQDYLTKPFLPQELLARADNLIAMKCARDALRQELAGESGNVAALATQLAVKHRQLHTALAIAKVAREQAEHASEVKTTFLGMVSHELRTPLATILMNAQMLAGPQEVAPQSLQKPRIDRLLRAATQMSTLVEGLLEYTRTESGKVNPRYESIDFVALAQEVIDAHADNLPAGVQLALEVPATGVPPLTSDVQLLKVVLGNLVSNALKFTRQGSVTVRLGSLPGWHELEVRDTGIGIAEADMARIFLPFEQLEPLQRKSIPGVGLGLALVKQIVDTLNGKVTITSVPGAGTTLQVRFPDVTDAVAERAVDAA